MSSLLYKYRSVKTPKDLYYFMLNNIKYGYLGKNGKIYNASDKNFYNDWLEQYTLEFTDDILKTRIGTCWDQVEVERNWFNKRGYEVKTIYEMLYLNYDNNFPTHSCLFYKDLVTDEWYWFECADYENRGIYKFKSFEDALCFQIEKYIKTLNKYNVSLDELSNIVIYEYKVPKRYMGVNDYIDFCLKGNKINIKNEVGDNNEYRKIL